MSCPALTAWGVWVHVCVGIITSASCSHSTMLFLFVDHPLCVSVPPHDVKRMAWNSTGNSSCPESELSQSSMPAAPLGSNTVAAKSNTKQSKITFGLTDTSFLFSSLSALVCLHSNTLCFWADQSRRILTSNLTSHLMNGGIWEKGNSSFFFQLILFWI